MEKHCLMCDDCEHYSYDKGHCSLGFIHINEERTDCVDVDLKCRHRGSETTYLTNYYPTYGDRKIARLKQIERRKEK